MVNMTLAIPEDLREMMKRHPEIKWSVVARRALRKYAERLDRLDILLQDSELTEEDVAELDHKVKKAMSKEYRKHL
jgi:hypothetical protein